MKNYLTYIKNIAMINFADTREFDIFFLLEDHMKMHHSRNSLNRKLWDWMINLMSLDDSWLDCFWPIYKELNR
jgi:hypothetical protein